jgi:NDP-sugar pyrophosphorylase family protein
MNVLILAAKKIEKGKLFPACLTLFEDQFLIEKILDQISVFKDPNLILTVNLSDNKNYHIDASIKNINNSAKIVYVNDSVKGAACSALLAVDLMNEEDLLILNSDEFVRYNFFDAIHFFKTSNFDAGVITFKSIHPKYSYVDINNLGFVIEAREKNPISLHATAGFYWFKSKKLFVESAEEMIFKSNDFKSNFYICPVFNELILKGLKIGSIEIDSKDFFDFK